MSRRSRWIATAAAVVVALACLVAWWLRSDPDPSTDATHDPRPTATSSAPAVEPEPDPCDAPARRPFVPERVTIDDVVEDAAVVGVPRDSRGVTGVLPISNKVDVAWDLGGIRPGSTRGNVLLNTHTWPDGSALGNVLLDELGKGDRIVLHGEGDTLLCYHVNRRIEVLAADGYPPYYDEDGRPQIALIVCSGTRNSAGNWSHRTIWFARPVA